MPLETPLFSIQSNSSDRELAFLSPRDDYFTVELRGGALCATQLVYAYTYGPTLTSLFARLASHERPWFGEERWDSLEGEFSLSATCSSLGTVAFLVNICGQSGAPEEWRVSASLITELGQMPKIAAGAQSFFGGT